MIKILFICHGNICRSPLCEYYFRDLVVRKGLSHAFETASAATSREEIGRPVHPGSKAILDEMGIDCSDKRARQITKSDYDNYDYLIVMDDYNMHNLRRFFGHDPKRKMHKLMAFSLEHAGQDVADPWYSGDFETTKQDVEEGCNALLEYILENDPRVHW